jgi:hypothetical protein
MKYCYTLHQRHPWSSHLKSLRAVGFKPSNLSTHDVEIVTPQTLQSLQQAQTIRIILLMANDWNTSPGREAVLNRIERLTNVSGGRDVAIVFYLGGIGNDSNCVADTTAQDEGVEGLRGLMEMTDA